MTFGEKLLKLRKEGGLSQEGLAEKLSVSRQAVSRWENEGILPDCVNLLEISRLFGVSTDYLLHDDYQSDGDLPAVVTTRDHLEAARKRQAETLFLAGLHAGLLLLAMGAWAAWQRPFPVVLCAIACLGDILWFEYRLRRSPVEPVEARSLRAQYYRFSVWFFAWFPVRWLCVGVFDYWPRPVNVININVVTVIIWLAVCGEIWLMTKGKE